MGWTLGQACTDRLYGKALSTPELKGQATIASISECTKTPHRHSPTIFTADWGIAQIFCSGNEFYPFESQREWSFASDF